MSGISALNLFKSDYHLAVKVQKLSHTFFSSADLQMKRLSVKASDDRDATTGSML